MPEFQHNKPFPKKREALPEAYQAVYVDWMRKNRGGTTQVTSLSTKLEQWMHRRVAADLKGKSPNTKVSTLELGSGTGNHLAFDARSDFYDVVEPMDELFELSPRNRIRQRYLRIEDVQGESIFDRVVSVAVLEHLEDLPGILRQAHRLLKPGGAFRAGIPSEGGWLWRRAWKNTTGNTFRNLYDLDYELLVAHEHLNTAVEIRAEIEKVFGVSEVEYFGLGHHFSFYQFVSATKH